jgi:acyl-CoA thioester hydrolase
MILARLEIDFRAPIAVDDEVRIEVRPVRVGTKSFELAYTMSVADSVVAEASTVLVAYDYARATSVEVPNAWREALAA